jgi:hypothetical protein
LITIRKLVTGFREIEEALAKTGKGLEWLEAQKIHGGRMQPCPPAGFREKI